MGTGERGTGVCVPGCSLPPEVPLPLVISSHWPACAGPAAPSGDKTRVLQRCTGASLLARSLMWEPRLQHHLLHGSWLPPCCQTVLLGDVSSFPPLPLSHTTLHDYWRALGHSLSTGPPLVSLQVSSLPVSKGTLSRLGCPLPEQTTSPGLLSLWQPHPQL